MITRPFNFQQWIDEHRHLLKPPVGNQQVFKDNKDFIVMVVGGPNARKDYHVDAGEELFWQLEGTMTVKIIEDGKPVDIVIGPGEMFLLPPDVPHSPRRPAGTVGLVLSATAARRARRLPVVLRKLRPQALRGVCRNHRHRGPAPAHYECLLADDDKRTCKVCGTYMEAPAK